MATKKTKTPAKTERKARAKGPNRAEHPVLIGLTHDEAELLTRAAAACVDAETDKPISRAEFIRAAALAHASKCVE